MIDQKELFSPCRYETVEKKYYVSFIFSIDKRKSQKKVDINQALFVDVSTLGILIDCKSTSAQHFYRCAYEIKVSDELKKIIQRKWYKEQNNQLLPFRN